MSNWSMTLTIPGQPPSTNHLYVRTRRGVAKAPGVEAYQTGVTQLVRTSKPSGWVPSGQIRLTYDFVLARNIDGDNLLKALNDAIAYGLSVDDRVFLPCVRSKRSGVSPRDAHVVVEIEGGNG